MRCHHSLPLHLDLLEKGSSRLHRLESQLGLSNLELFAEIRCMKSELVDAGTDCLRATHGAHFERIFGDKGTMRMW